MMSLRPLKNLFLIVYAVSSLVYASNKDNDDLLAKRLLPLASGTFWQIGSERLHRWSDAELAAEVRVLKEMGIEFLIIHYTAYWSQVSNSYDTVRSEEHTSELQSREKLVCRLLLEKKKIRLSEPVIDIW